MTQQSSTESEQQILSLPSKFKKTGNQSDDKIKSPQMSCSETNEFEHDMTKSSKGTEKDVNHESHEETSAALQESSLSTTPLMEKRRTLDEAEGTVLENSGRERLKRHRIEMAGRVWIPEMWGQEKLLKDWIDCTAFDAALVNSSIMSARAALLRRNKS